MVSSGAGPLATAAAEPEDLKVLRAYLIDNKVDTAKAAKELGVTIAANNNALSLTRTPFRSITVAILTPMPSNSNPIALEP